MHNDVSGTSTQDESVIDAAAEKITTSLATSRGHKKVLFYNKKIQKSSLAFHFLSFFLSLINHFKQQQQQEIISWWF
jgi:hypothetical protein